MKKIGIVGLGIMGRGMVNNFVKNGYEVFVWNRTRSVAEEMKGVTVCNTPEEVSKKADIIFEITANDESSEEVWLGEEGIMKGANTSKVLIISATVSTNWVDKLIKECGDRNFQLIDSPLTGGRVGAESGNLTLLCGGDEKLINELKPIFEAIAGNVFYFGPSGSGMKYKLILNYVQAAHIVTFGQAMKMAKAAGMDLKKIGEALAFKPGGIINEISNKAYFKDPDPVTFSIKWIMKDLKYAEKFANNMGLKPEMLEAALDEYEKLSEKDMDKDWASVNKLLADKE